MNLAPGVYVLEIEFSRPVAKETLARVLEAAGLSPISFDESVPLLTFGAPLAAAPRGSSTTPATTTATASKTLVQAAAPARAAAIATQVVAAPRPAPAPVSPVFDPRKAVTAPIAARPLTPTISRTAAPLVAPASAPASRIAPGASFTPAAAPTPAYEPPPTPAYEPPLAPAYEPSTPDAPAYGPPPSGERAAVGPAIADAPAQVLAKVQELWRRWAEWGSPFATSPMSVSGAGSRRVRILTRIHAPTRLSNSEAFRWVWASPLAFDPFSDLALDFVPHVLLPGVTYELRMLGRDKSAPTRKATSDLLTGMGFTVHKLHALKRNMRLPGRPGTSLSAWWAMATWRGPKGPIVLDDPLFFESVAPTLAT